MLDFQYSFYYMIKSILFFLLFFVLIPAKTIGFEKETTKFLDKFFISLTHGTMISIIVVHFLSFLKIYETISLLFSYVLLFFALHWYRGRSWRGIADAMGLKFIVHLLDLSEGRTGLLYHSVTRFKELLIQTRTQLLNGIITGLKNPFQGLFPILILLGAFYLRFIHAMSSGIYTVSDSYLHLIWLKMLDFNQIYPQGIYPFGYHAVLSALSNLTNIDPYWIIRFIGPFAGFLTVLAVYHFALRLTESYVASLLALTVYGLVNNPAFPVTFIRHMAALPQEFAAVFVLPGIYFLWLYIKTQKISFLVLFSEVLVITVIIHPYATIYFGLGAGLLLSVLLLARRVKLRNFFYLAGFSLASLGIALLPFGIGMLMGLEFYQSSTSYIQGAIKSGTISWSILPDLLQLIKENVFFEMGVVFSIISGLGIIFRRLEGRGTFLIGVWLYFGVMFLLYKAPELGLPSVMDPYRTGMFFAPVLSVIYAVGFDSVNRILPKLSNEFLDRVKIILIQGGALIICMMTVFQFPPVETKINPFEYEAAVNNYLQIKREFLPLDWTIVAPTEQYQQAIGSGWHYEVLRFIQDFTPEEVANPKFQFPIPTHHIFIYTEKIPLHLDRIVTTADAEMDLEPEGNDPFMQYYHTGSQRGILEAKATRLMESYRRTHPDTEIYYEDEEMRIYYIYHEPPELSNN